LDEGRDDYSQGETEDGKRYAHTKPEEEELESFLGFFVGVEGLSRKEREYILDQVRGVHDSTELNAHGSVEGE
jgi:hypothetical protein